MFGERTYHSRPIEEQNDIRYELKIKCTNLKVKESSIEVRELQDGHALYDSVYSTEVVYSKSDAEYQKTIVVDYFPETNNKKLIFQLFSCPIGKKRKHMGEFKISHSTVCSEPGHIVKGEIIDDGKVNAKIEIVAKEMKNSYKLALLYPEIKEISKSAAYFKIYNQSTLIYISEVSEKSKSSTFLSVLLPFEIFNCNDMERELKVHVFDSKKDELIGETDAIKTVELIDANNKSYPIYNPNKNSKTISILPTGYFIVTKFETIQKETKEQQEIERQKFIFENVPLDQIIAITNNQ